MRAFRAERSFGAALLLLAAAPAVAQTGAPVPLLPPSPSSALPSAAPPPLLAPAPATSGEANIEAEPLAPVNSSWTGTLGATERALPHDMWSTTPRAFVTAALPLLQPTNSPVLQDLTRRLLLSDAAPPRGQEAPGAPSLIDRRVDRVLAYGFGDGAALVSALPQNHVSEIFDRDTVELRIVAGDLAGACGVVSDRASRYQDQWGRQAIIACQALTGAYDQASLGLGALREQKTPRDPVFEALIDAILGHRTKLDKLSDPTPLRIILLAAAKLPLPADTLANAGPAALAVWATSDKVPIAARLTAGEKAVAFGALPPAALGLLYGAVEAKPEEAVSLLKSARLADDPRLRAILYDLARTSDPGASRAAALAPLIADARRRGAFMAMAQLVAPLVAELQPLPDLQSFAGDAARVLLAVRDYEHAAPWIALAGRAELRAISDFALSSSTEDNAPPLADAIAALTALDAAAAPHQVDLLVSLAAALGEPLGQVDVAGLLRANHQGVLPNGTLWLDQQAAAKQGRLAETVLTTVLLASAGDRLSAEPIMLARAVAGLQAVGLDADAKALAIEAALDAGI